MAKVTGQRIVITAEAITATRMAHHQVVLKAGTQVRVVRNGRNHDQLKVEAKGVEGIVIVDADRIKFQHEGMTVGTVSRACSATAICPEQITLSRGTKLRPIHDEAAGYIIVRQESGKEDIHLPRSRNSYRFATVEID